MSAFINLYYLLSLWLIIQTVLLYSVDSSDETQVHLSKLSLNKNIHNQLSDDDINNFDDSEESKAKSTSSISSTSFDEIKHRRNSRQHWNPLVAAYKRCSELIPFDERETCFKNAIQKLFLHKLKK